MAPHVKAAANSAAFSELANALRRCARPLAGVAIFSAIINILALTGSIYMLQVYDRVLPSRSMPTLIGLTFLMIGLYAAFGFFDLLRSRIMMRIGSRFDRLLRKRVFAASLMLPLRVRQSTVASQPVRDLEQIRGFMSGQGPIALFDMPWLPLYLLLVFLMHPLLGLAAAVGAGVLVALTLMTEYRSRLPAKATAESVAARQSFADAAQRNAEIVCSLGLSVRMGDRWEQHCEAVQRDQTRALEVTGGLSSVSRVFRMVLQSALLGLGAYVVIRGEATGGVMIAASIMTSRALAPIEIAIANWRGFMAARQSYERLGKVLANIHEEPDHLSLPRPRFDLVVDGLFVGAPGEQRPIIQNVAFTLQSGDGLGVIGPSASGKSTLARAVVGVWPALRGTIRLDGATLDQFESERLGCDIGYLPQDIELFEGTVAANIARFDPNATSDGVIAAARAAGAHDMILHLPEGYDTHIGDAGARLSGGQRQRLALARALYGDPFLVVLDEPNSNLDSEGEAALTTAIASVRKRGGIVIVVAHRPAALSALNLVMVLANGQIRAMGPKEEVMSRAIQPVPTVAAPPPPAYPEPRFGGQSR